MKGASRMVGLVALADACERVEAVARASDVDRIGAAREALRRELDRAHAFVASRLEV
jgi:HPt (histidine-containing phosphotransfer) domain-containing protein